MEWQPIETAPEGVEIMTKIDDEHGVRNERTLVKRTREPGKTRPMFFAQGSGFCVYYTPTHWRPV
jgi:hypothetical protein